MLNFLKVKERNMLKVLNLKEDFVSTDQALAMVEIEIERCAFDGCVAIKVLHGYGSHGKGGKILIALRQKLRQWKRNGFIKNYFAGDKWDVFDKDAWEILQADKSISGDEDLGRANPGITIIAIK